MVRSSITKQRAEDKAYHTCRIHNSSDGVMTVNLLFAGSFLKQKNQSEITNVFISYKVQKRSFIYRLAFIRNILLSLYSLSVLLPMADLKEALSSQVNEFSILCCVPDEPACNAALIFLF